MSDQQHMSVEDIIDLIHRRRDLIDQSGDVAWLSEAATEEQVIQGRVLSAEWVSLGDLLAAILTNDPKHWDVMPELGPIPDYGEKITLDQFLRACVANGFTPEDGSGYLATATEMSDVEVFSVDTIPHWVTHVVWFNK